MKTRIKVLDLELTQPLVTVTGLAGYTHLQGLVRWYGQPVGYTKLPVSQDRVLASDLRKKVIEDHGCRIVTQLVRNGLAPSSSACELDLEKLFQLPPPPLKTPAPTISVAVCTRDRTEDLAKCLTALQNLKHPPLEIIVVDNAPRTEATRELIEKDFSDVRYFLEPHPGLDWARNRAIAEAQGDIVAYTDDDVVVDYNWTAALAKTFGENPEVMAITGLVVPYELETEAQILFEEYGGFGRGFERKWYRGEKGQKIAQRHGGTGKFGTGANMAYRRILFSEIGDFDPALDVGTVTQGGGDLEMFFRTLKTGHTLVYEPAAIVRHRHRREYEKLHTQIASNGIGFYSFLVRSAMQYPEERVGFFRLAWWWLNYWNIRRLIKSYFKPDRLPRELLWAELRGSFIGLFRYQKAQKNLPELFSKYGAPVPRVMIPKEEPALKILHYGVAVRTIDLTNGINALSDVVDYPVVRLYLTYKNYPIGQIDFSNYYQPISRQRLGDLIFSRFLFEFFNLDQKRDSGSIWAEVMTALEKYLAAPETSSAAVELPKEVSVSVVVATANRPHDLRKCLRSLTAQVTPRKVEIVVVDNRPELEGTRLVVAEFPGVVLVNESRRGLSYARNAGFFASTGDILITTDDDVTMPPDWIEKLVTPFVRNDVMAVTGNVFPAQLETGAEIQFENYGGLGRGFKRHEYNRDWFDYFRRKAVPTWEIGATANAAIRASLLTEIGMLDEALGAGMPTGCSEDTYLFYRALKAGHTIIYEPSAFVWHKHRCREDALRNQIFSYSKGHVAYHLTTFLRDQDCRGLARIFLELPRFHAQRIWWWIQGYRRDPLSMIFLEAYGNLLGFSALWQARKLVKTQGTSLRCGDVSLPAATAIANGSFTPTIYRAPDENQSEKISANL